MCWDCYDHPHGDPYKIYTQGGVEVDDFDKEVDYRPRKKNKKKPVKKKGCEGNDFGPHVYVWSKSRYEDSFFYRFYGFPRSETKTCVGCGRSAGYRRSEEYQARAKKEFNKRYKMVVERGEPVSRRSRYGRYAGSASRYYFEYSDAEYQAAYREHRLKWREYYDRKI